MSTVIIVLLLIVIVIYAFINSKQHFKGEGGCCGGQVDTPIKKKLTHPIIGAKKIELSGMHCQNCASQITKIIQSYNGVSADVRLEEKCVIISYDQEVNVQDICIDIEKAGYQVISMKDHIIL